VCAYVICEPQVHSSFNLYFLIIKNNRVSYTLKDTFSGFILSRTKSQNRYILGFGNTILSAEYRSSTFTGVKLSGFSVPAENYSFRKIYE